jgi:predicted DCC family thiol-disulfide oxidoreductase YuxK
LHNGWTGGQYSIIRMLLAVGLLITGGPAVAASGWSNAVVAILSGALLFAGWQDRVAAILLWCALAYAAGLAMPAAGWLLLWHAWLPAAPYGSLAARDRVDPGGNWRMPPPAYATAWVALAVFHSWALETWLMRALAIAALFTLAAIPRLRLWVWAVSWILPAPEVSGTLLLHLVTLDPAWIPPRRDGEILVFYDGQCALCHGFVRFLLAEEGGERGLRFAPLCGPRFYELVSAEQRIGLADSVVARTAGGELRQRSAATVTLLERLGGLWRAGAVVIRLAPRALRDRVYDFVARFRYRVFGKATEVCPLLPAGLRGYFHE